MSKQIRVSDAHYKVLSEMSKELKITRVEILGNAIGLIKKLVDNNATSVKMVCGDQEKEILITLLMGFVDAS
ncbi:hypothetical protein LCGC14_1474350 [marine sediment metagenome]|uniref:Ribbon-helix-helix protein CopG domain-containing protein n=1 Tax=marine sediment metagenome TaxID=412755 RepID=A0A0F9MD37_9ZZZZ